MKRLLVAQLIFATIGCLPLGSRAEDVGLRTPNGFQVELYAGDELAHNIYSMTIDSHGRVVVAGPGCVRILHDEDGDGKADKATLFSDVPKSGAHGMVFDGEDLICTGDNAVMKLRDTDGDGIADGKPEIWTRLGHSEHGANGVTIGPDGWIYVICGNDAGVSENHATTPNSPVKKPQAGAIVRFSPDGKQSEIVAHGFRNPYDLAFNEHGHIFTVDADGERDQYLPWYTPTRLFDVAQGMHHGWVLKGWKRSWNRPEYFFDNVPRLVEIGRGSPTGVEVYRHRQFPKRYRGSVFSCCWTLGRVYHFPLKQKGSSYESHKEIFLETTGDVGFAPVDLAVGPEGELFVAIGGRGTRGSVFRVSYTTPEKYKEPDDPLEKLLAAPQPLASWSRAKWIPAARELGQARFEDVLELDALHVLNTHPLSHEVRAVEILTELFEGLPNRSLLASPAKLEGALAARLVWSRQRSHPREDWSRDVRRVANFALPQRAAWEALAIAPKKITLDATHWHSWFGHYPIPLPDRRVLAAQMLAMTRVERAEAEVNRFEKLSVKPEWRMRKYTVLAALGKLSAQDLVHVATELRTHFDKLEQSPQKVRLRLEAVRAMQLAVGDMQVAPGKPDVYAGYAARNLEPLTDEQIQQAARNLAEIFPTGHSNVDREIARLLGMLSVDTAGQLDKVSRQIKFGKTPLQDTMHYLIVLSRLPGERSEVVTSKTASVLGSLHILMLSNDFQPSRNWSLRVGEVFDELCRRDPKLAAALVKDVGFYSPEQSFLALRMPKKQRQAAARKFLKALESESEDWTASFVELVTTLPPEESLPALRAQWSNYALRDAIVTVLAKRPQAEDRGRFVESLQSAQPEIVRQAAAALKKLGGSGSAEEVAMALRVLRRFCAARQFSDVRRELAGLLNQWTGQQIDLKEAQAADLVATYQPWFAWFAEAHPQQAKVLAASGAADAASWRKRLKRVDWSSGDAERGEKVFQRRSCHQCHTGNSKLGPDLAGAAGRFSRDDLFTAIVDPHKDVSPLYQTTQMITQSGKVYHGLVVYASPDGTLLQTDPNTTVRIAGDKIVESRQSRLSIMPTGLLNEVTDKELADLYAYLETLRAR